MRPVFLMRLSLAFLLIVFLSGCTGSNGAEVADENLGDYPGHFNNPENSSFHRRPSGEFNRSFNGTRDRNFSDANRTLPEEFLSACSGKAEGEECTASTVRGNMSGKCMNREGRLFCAPQVFNQT